MKRIIKTFIIIQLSITSLMAQQDIEFSQYYNASLYLNPAFAGAYTKPTFNTNYKQFVSSGVTQHQLAQASVILPIIVEGAEAKQIGGVGISGYYRRTGLNGNLDISGVMLNYAQTIKLGVISPDVLSVSVQGVYQTTNQSLSDLTWGSQANYWLQSAQNPQAGPPPVTEFDSNVSKFVLNAGVMYYYNRNRNYLLYNYSAFSGIAVKSINRPVNGVFQNDEDARDPIEYIYHGAIEFNFKNLYIIPTAYLRFYNLDTYQVNVGGYISYALNRSRGFSLDSRGTELVFGTWYRVQDSFILITGINHDNYSINLSYDLNDNVFSNDDLANSAWLQPSFEISFRYNINRANNIRNISNPLF